MTKRARLDAKAAKDNNIVANQVCRVRHSRLKRLPHLFVIERLLDLDSGLDLLPLLQNDVKNPHVAEALGLLVLLTTIRCLIVRAFSLASLLLLNSLRPLSFFLLRLVLDCLLLIAILAAPTAAQ